jgi:hypothetical protein
MAVVACIPNARGTGVSGKFGESFTFTRRWSVRVDSPTTSTVAISRAPGVRFGDAYPDFPSHVAMEFDCTEASGDAMAWDVTVRYYLPPFENRPNPDTGLPRDCWSAGGSGATIPVFKDKDGNKIVNSAGEPLEGAERESTEFVLNLTKCYSDLAWSSIAKSRTNTVNASEWNSSPARRWKAAFRSAQKKEMSVTGAADDAATTKTYWEVSWEFHYRQEGWVWEPWDVGFNQLVTSDGTPSASGTRRAAILGADKKPVRSPVALASGVAKTPGQPPDALTFYLYPETDFSVFGNPS